MSQSDVLDTIQQLRGVWERLNSLLVAYQYKPEILGRIHLLCEVVGYLGMLAPEEINSTALSALEELIQRVDTPSIEASTDITLHMQGNAYIEKFKREGDPGDLERAIISWRRAVDLALDSSPYKPIFFNSLGEAMETRFAQYGALADLEDAILQKRKAVNLTPDSHPEKPRCLSSLGIALKKRFGLLNEPADLEEAILQQRKAVDLTPDDHPYRSIYLNNLGNVLMKRFDRYGSLPDLEDAILQKQKVLELTPDSHPDKIFRLSNLGSALLTRFGRCNSLADLEDAILQKRKAADLTPDDHPDKPDYLSSLAIALETRFGRQGSLADLEDAISQQRKAVSLTPDNRPNKPAFINNLGVALLARFDHHGSLADLEEAISQQRKAIGLTPDAHPDRLGRLITLEHALYKRFSRQGTLADLEEAILQMRKAVELTPDDHPDKPMYLSNLGNTLESRFERQSSATDLEDALLQHRKAVDLTPEGHPKLPGRLNNLGNALERKFRLEGDLLDLDNSILHRQKALLLMPNDDVDRAPCLNNLGRVLKLRFQWLRDQSDLQGALSAARESAESSVASSKHRLQSAQLWANCCTLGLTSSLPAHDCVVKLLPRIAWLGLAADDQYFLLAEAGSATRDAVAAAIAEGEYVTAVEWAEQGRSIVWQNLLSLRTPLEELRSKHPELSIRLQDLSNRLEQPTETWDTSSGSRRSDTANDPMKMAMERDILIEEIRGKPGFESFMKPKSLDGLAPAARDGPIVFINLGTVRCDALALLTDDRGAIRVLLTPLERVTLQKAEKLSEKLAALLSKSGVRARTVRKHKVQGASDSKSMVFGEILRTLWLDYVQPILNTLAYEVDLESPPRLWWCATGPLAFLPIHAAGIYDISEPGHKLSDYVVSSYTPALTALLDEPSLIPSNDFSILTVAISNTPGAPLPCTEEEVQTVRHLAANLPVTSLTNEGATKERVLEKLDLSNWAHLACHGEQVGGKPMESGLILEDGKLELSEIVKAKLPNAEFVFLSACQTAVGDGGVPEESAHLAAGMLFAGYRGVVATMWSIQDDIAPRVAEDFYRYMFRHGQPRRAEAAYALHKAVRSLQESGVPFTSWVPFIHVGR